MGSGQGCIKTSYRGKHILLSSPSVSVEEFDVFKMMSVILKIIVFCVHYVVIILYSFNRGSSRILNQKWHWQAKNVDVDMKTR